MIDAVLGARKKQFCPYCGDKLDMRVLDGVERLFCQTCRDAVYENPIPATCLVVPNSDGHVLLVKRKVPPKKGKWCLPGGFMELEESPEQGALRELKEETNLTGRIDRMLGVIATASSLYHTVLLIGYLVSEWSGMPKALDDAEAIRFFPRDNLPPIAFTSHEHFIRIYDAAYAIK